MIFVPHLDCIAAAPRRVAVINPDDNSFVLIEPLLVVSLDFAEQPSSDTRSSNGQSTSE